MAIHIEVYDHTQEFIKTVLKETILVEDYFNFDLNDIDLNIFFKILREGKNSNLLTEYTHLPKSSKNIKDEYEFRLGKNENLEKIVYEDFKEIYSKITD